MNNENEMMDWDDEISQESSFTLLPAGDYPFIVVGFERKKFEPNPQRQSKIPAGTNMASVEMEFKADDGSTTRVTENLFLLKKMEWKMSEFFLSIGQKKKGEPFHANWPKVLGSSGKATLEVNTYMKDGNEQQNNRVKKFLEKTDEQVDREFDNKMPSQPQPQQNVTPFPGAGGGWK
ncbi:MAG: hypothetical protein LBV19_06195 [Streptococcaceae bacterium]|jgi:hypothetical protein|nr:hypothetical protein [Streptococcaceae bacterium]